jgi:hypothetical protein
MHSVFYGKSGVTCRVSIETSSNMLRKRLKSNSEKAETQENVRRESESSRS